MCKVVVFFFSYGCVHTCEVRCVGLFSLATETSLLSYVFVNEQILLFPRVSTKMLYWQSHKLNGFSIKLLKWMLIEVCDHHLICFLLCKFVASGVKHQ